jgi:hypothetical protein
MMNSFLMVPAMDVLKARLIPVCLIALSALPASWLKGEETSPAPATPAEAVSFEGQVTGIEVFPSEVSLKGQLDYRQLMVTGLLPQGLTVDLTRVCQIEAGGGAIRVLPSGRIEPVSNGTQTLTVRYGAFTKQIPVQVQEAESLGVVNFLKDVQPVMGRLGCNQGTCHGAADGKAGFKLSLRGYDAIADHMSLVDDIAGRRMNRAAPERSLMLLKPTGEVPHAGGALMKTSDRGYKVLKAWIAAGVPLDMNVARVDRIEVFPQNPVLPEAAKAQQMVVLAHYSDGTVRDVTGEAFVESGNIEVLAAEPNGVVKLLRRGEAPVLVRYEGRYVATTLTVMGKKSDTPWVDVPQYNYIDQLVDEKLKRIQVVPSGLCTDEEFIRRIYLDLTGTVPNVAEIESFVKDARPSREKRDALVDQLIGSQGFIESWTNKWSDLLQVNRKFLGESGASAFRAWIRQQVAENRPYDQFAKEILLASGSNLQTPPASYYKILRDPLELMENTTHLFLAIRFNCNRCHDHPFERWTQDQYYDLAAFFADVAMKEDPRFSGQFVGGTAVMGAQPLVEVIFDRQGGQVKNERTGKVVEPSFPYQFTAAAAASGNGETIQSLTRRQKLADWLTSKNNPYFAKSYVNRIWSYMLGVGIIEPVDDIRAGNPPTNPALLEALTKDFIDHGFDTRHLIATICKSRSYQLTLQTNPSNVEDTINYSHAIARRLPAEVLYDAIYKATGATTRIGNLPPGTRAAELPDAGISLPFLDDFGRPVRESACECERSSGVVLGPIIKLVNGDTVAAALTQPDSELNKMVAAEMDDKKLIDNVFLRFLGRLPTAQEATVAVESLQAPGKELADMEAKVAEFEKSVLRERVTQWAGSLVLEPNWEPITWTDAQSTAGATLAPQPDGSFLVTGNLALDKYILRTKVNKLSALRIEALTDPSLPAQGPGRATDGNFVLNEFVVKAAPEDRPNDFVTIPLVEPQADFSQENYDVKGAIDGNSGSGWAIAPQMGKNHEAIFLLSEALSGDKPWIVTLELDQQFNSKQHTLGKFRITHSQQIGKFVRGLDQALVAAIKTPVDQRTDEHWNLLKTAYVPLDPEWQKMQESFKQIQFESSNRRMVGVQDLAWALINSPAFLFNR